MSQTTARADSASWISARIKNTSDSLDRALAQGLTGHVFTKRDGKRVRLEDGTDAVEFVSCSYLGLEQHSDLVVAAHEALDQFGVHISSARNRARPPYLRLLEDRLRDIYHGSQPVVFTSVSSVHLGVLPLLGTGALPSYPIASGGVGFLIERTAHASMQVLRGVLEQIGPVRRFEQSDPQSLEEGLAGVTASRQTPVVLADGVGSMGGLADVTGMLERVTRHHGHLYLDDAHGTSIAGPRGGGYAFDVFGDRLPTSVLLAQSLSKAFGGTGACAVLPTEADARMLVKFANPLVFGHSIPVPALAATAAAAKLHLNGTVAQRQQTLWQVAADFDELTDHKLVNAGLRCPIRGAVYDTEEAAFTSATQLREAGVLILPAFFPTVPVGTGLIRFALSALHEPAHLAQAARTLRSVSRTRIEKQNA